MWGEHTPDEQLFARLSVLPASEIIDYSPPWLQNSRHNLKMTTFLVLPQ